MAPSTKRSDPSADPQNAAELVEWLVNPDAPEAPAKPPDTAQPEDHLDTTYQEVMRATRWCVLYGSGGFAVLCILIGAVEALFGR